MDKIPKLGFFQSSIGVTVEKILIHLGRYLKRLFPIIYTRYVKLVKPFVSFQEIERREEEEKNDVPTKEEWDKDKFYQARGKATEEMIKFLRDRKNSRKQVYHSGKR